MNPPSGITRRAHDRQISTSRRAIAALVVLVLIIVSGCTDPNPDAEDSRKSDIRSREYEATIRRTTNGVAHITASDLGNLAFGQGYASGEDHTCDLAQEVVKVNSQRSRWFGPGEDDANLTSDFGWLALQVRERAEADYPKQSDEAHEMMAGFVAGWNQHLDEVGRDNIPGWCQGQPWVQPITELDLYTYSRSVMLLASGAQLIDYIANAHAPVAADAQSTVTSESASNPGVGPTDSRNNGVLAQSEPLMASNGWAIGSQRSDSGGGLLLANPHFPWEGPLRFWEVGLEIPGEMNVYGAQLTGLPGVGIGFNDAVAWTHTVSAGKRFTAYTLELADGDPTAYRYDDEVRKMESRETTVEVLQPDGSITSTSRTLWRSHYGPMVDFPGVGWTTSQAMTYRDANLDNTEYFDQYLGMDRARSLDEFIDAHAEHTGVPLFNTVATGADGRAWYADTSATPNLSAAALSSYEETRAKDLLVSMAARRGVVLLDGSTSQNEWVDEPGARSPGLVPFTKMPQTVRNDYVFNANDSFWLSNATEMLVGTYSPLHGSQEAPVSPRTHQNATLLRDGSPSGASGADGRFSLDELTEAAFSNEGWTAHQLRAEVVSRCTPSPTIEVPDSGSLGQPSLPASSVDLGEACAILGKWDGRYDLDSVGAAIWREFLAQFDSEDLSDAGALFANPFDPTNPVDSPSGLSSVSAQTTVGSPDPILVALARAVQVFEVAGLEPNTPLGDIQHADRDRQRVPIHGGNASDGVINVVTWAGPAFPTGESLPEPIPKIAPWSSLTTSGYLVNAGTSFVLAVQFTDAGPIARSILTYSNTANPSSPQFVSATEDFSTKQWKPVRFTDDQVERDPELTTRTVHN